MVLQAEEVAHLYALLDGVFSKFSYCEYPLVRERGGSSSGGGSSGSMHVDATTNDNLKFKAGTIQQHDIDRLDLKNTSRLDTVRAFDHVDGNMRILVYPGEVLGSGVYGSVYGIQVAIWRDTGTTDFVDLALKIQDAPLPAFEVGPLLEPNQVDEIVPSTFRFLQPFMTDTQKFTSESGPRPFPHQQRRIHCQPWYIEPIMLHAIQESGEIADTVKQMSPLLYVSLVIRGSGDVNRSILLMERFRNVSTLATVLKNNLGEKLNFVKTVRQPIVYVHGIQKAFGGCVLDMHNNNMLVNAETSDLKVVDPSLAVFTYEGIRFESKYSEPNFVAQRSNLRLMVLANDYSQRWCREAANKHYFRVLLFAAWYGVGGRYSITRRALELLDLCSQYQPGTTKQLQPDPLYETNFTLAVNTSPLALVSPQFLEAIEESVSSRKNLLINTIWLLYSTLQYRVDSTFTYEMLTKMVRWCTYLRDLRIEFTASASGVESNQQTLRLILPSICMRSVTIKSDVPVELQVFESTGSTGIQYYYGSSSSEGLVSIRNRLGAPISLLPAPADVDVVAGSSSMSLLPLPPQSMLPPPPPPPPPPPSMFSLRPPLPPPLHPLPFVSKHKPPSFPPPPNSQFAREARRIATPGRLDGIPFQPTPPATGRMGRLAEPTILPSGGNPVNPVNSRKRTFAFSSTPPPSSPSSPLPPPPPPLRHILPLQRHTPSPSSPIQTPSPAPAPPPRKRTKMMRTPMQFVDLTQDSP